MKSYYFLFVKKSSLLSKNLNHIYSSSCQSQSTKIFYWKSSVVIRWLATTLYLNWEKYKQWIEYPHKMCRRSKEYTLFLLDIIYELFTITFDSCKSKSYKTLHKYLFFPLHPFVMITFSKWHKYNLHHFLKFSQNHTIDNHNVYIETKCLWHLYGLTDLLNSLFCVSQL